MANLLEMRVGIYGKRGSRYEDECTAFFVCPCWLFFFFADLGLHPLLG